jgi:hypothetical protein
VFAHYYRGTNEIRFIDPSELGEAATGKEIAGRFESHRRIWHIRSRSWDKDPGDILLRALPAHGDSVFRWSGPGVDLILYGRRAPLQAAARRAH